jgi:ribose transport system substrate-binding protein
MKADPWARIRFVVAAVLLVTACMVIVACGDDDDDDGGSATQSTTSDVAANADAVLEEAYKGYVDPPPETGPKGQAGKTIWLSNCVAFEGCARFGTGVKAAAEAIGWNVKEVDNKANPAESIAIMRQAVAAGADGIIETLSDCPLVKSGLQAAKSAGVPVVTLVGLDCDYEDFGGAEPLYAAVAKLGDRETPLDYYAEQGELDADFILALAAKQGIENPAILQTQNHNQLFQKVRAQHFEDRIKEKCPDCELEPLVFTTDQLASGKGQQVFKSGILANPNMDVLYYANDAFLAPGLQAAIESNKGKFEIICCGDGGKQGIENVRRGDLAETYAVNVAPVEMWGWDIVDVLNRLLAGESREEIPGQAHVSWYVDKDHGLPPEGEEVEIPFDYESAYTNLWSTGSSK